ncbi:hypothetical protein BS50DRAFT_327730 [Corynespora cassiicola Philippines]|uniref:Uncharacterized protein n=1 Tax=Corynespora cassiicola Philippines TaxID=1448308 RepID=A0A2T2NU22_CORCC|nr:hypothetical protein BS50DRAFT_327730 [Corynespora cassiicola Philippines]
MRRLLPRSLEFERGRRRTGVRSRRATLSPRPPGVWCNIQTSCLAHSEPGLPMAMLDRHAVTPAAMLSSTPISMPQLGTIVPAPLAPSERLSLPFRTLLACRWTLWHVSTAGEAPFETNFFSLLLPVGLRIPWPKTPG